MQRVVLSSLAAVFVLGTGNVVAQEPVAKSRIVTADLFRNGLAVIRREVIVPGPGVYQLDDVPEPIHGTFWVESKVAVEAAVKLREVANALPVVVQGRLDNELAGRKVTVTLKNGKTIQGTALKVERPRQVERSYSPYYALPLLTDNTPQTDRFLILHTPPTQTFVDSAEIVALEVAGFADKAKQRKPVLILTVVETASKPLTMHISYLTRGLAWASSYRVDISDRQTLAIELGALIKNELTDLQDAEIRLISGFPSVPYSRVTSLLSPRSHWATFIREMRGEADPPDMGLFPGMAAMMNPMGGAPLTQAILPDEGLARRPDLSAKPVGEGVDLHYQSIGKRSLGNGEALALPVAKAKAPYERLVQWLIPDHRNEYGQLTSQEGEENANEGTWDALVFKNPFPFPMTTAPALITTRDRFNGQRTSYYVTAGEETFLPITKAINIRTHHTEEEETDPNSADIVYVAGRAYGKHRLLGQLTVNNHRQEEIKLVIRRRFGGNLLKAEGSPKIVRRAEGLDSINRRHELVWTLTLKPGEERKLTYKYLVLVAR